MVKFFFIVFLIHSNIFAYFELSKKSEPGVMNDIKFEEFKDFQSKWHLVTVRYRLDSGEMRFTYANDIAWQDIKKLKPDYSDGAIFGKVGLITEKDPAFTSSLVPSGTKRFQLMVKNKKKYKDTDGWGYALFDQNGGLFPGNIKTATLACAACHRLVPERDYVFSRPALIDSGANTLIDTRSKFMNELNFFKKEKTDNQTGAFKKMIKSGFKVIYILAGQLKNNAFSGTLDEVVPLLIENSSMTGDPSALYIDNNNFTLVSPSTSDKNCAGTKVSYHIFIKSNNSTVRDATICQ